MSIPAVENVDAVEGSGLHNFAKNVIAELKDQENTISEALKDGLDKSGEVQKMPDYMLDRFKHWRENFTSPEEIALIDGVELKVTEMMNSASKYAEDSVESKTKRARLELAVKSISRLTQGIQQLLASQ